MFTAAQEALTGLPDTTAVCAALLSAAPHVLDEQPSLGLTVFPTLASKLCNVMLARCTSAPGLLLSSTCSLFSVLAAYQQAHAPHPVLQSLQRLKLGVDAEPLVSVKDMKALHGVIPLLVSKSSAAVLHLLVATAFGLCNLCFCLDDL